MQSFVVMRLPDSGDEVCRNLAVILMVLVVGGYIPNCLGVCCRFDVHVCYKHKYAAERRRTNLVGDQQCNVSVL